MLRRKVTFPIENVAGLGERGEKSLTRRAHAHVIPPQVSGEFKKWFEGDDDGLVEEGLHGTTAAKEIDAGEDWEEGSVWPKAKWNEGLKKLVRTQNAEPISAKLELFLDGRVLQGVEETGENPKRRAPNANLSGDTFRWHLVLSGDRSA